MTPKHKEQKKKKDKSDLIKLENFCASENTIKKVKSQLTVENSCKSFERLLIYKKLANSTIKNSPFKNVSKGSKYAFLQESYIHDQYTLERILKILNN